MDKTALRTAAAKYGTPLYLFDLEAFTARAQRVRAAFGSDVNLCYSMKANPFVLRGLPDVFRWVEVCSPGELTICERLGIPPERILYSGVNKGADDVARAVALGADLLTAESTLHFDLICAAAAAQGKHVRVLPRLTAGSQFGMDPDALADLVARRAEFPNVTIVGIHYFSGTQKRKDAVIAKELAHLDEYLTMLHERYGFTAQHVEYGPGLNAECFRDDAEARDGGMHQVKYDGQLMGMQAPPLTLLRESADAPEPWMLCGSLCTTADVLVREAQLPPLRVGDVIALGRCGAYSVTEGVAVFLSRDMPRVALYRDGNFTLVRDRFATDALNTCRTPEDEA